MELTPLEQVVSKLGDPARLPKPAPRGSVLKGINSKLPSKSSPLAAPVPLPGGVRS